MAQVLGDLGVGEALVGAIVVVVIVILADGGICAFVYEVAWLVGDAHGCDATVGG